MKIAIIGAGVIGVLSAYYLQKRGYTVHVYDAADDIAQHASGANAGQLSYSYTEPLGSATTCARLPRVLAGRNDSIRLQDFDLKLLSWGLGLLKNSLPPYYRRNKTRLKSLARQSQQLMQDFLKQDLFDFHYQENGKLYLFDHISQRDIFTQNAQKTLPQRILTAQECFKMEPWLKNRRGHLIGGLLAEKDARGDCALFCQHLKTYLEHTGDVTFHARTTIENIHTQGAEITAMSTTDGDTIHADAYLICTGAYADKLLKTIKTRQYVYPVKGYSLNIPNSEIYPIQRNITDYPRSLVLAPFPSYLRISSLVRFDGYNTDIRQDDLDIIQDKLSGICPELSIKDAQVFCGLRPYTPSSCPQIGALKYDNLFVNIGHGMLGWTLAHATCFQTADIIDTAQNNA